MPELEPFDPAAPMVEPREPRRLPAWLRYPLAILMGAVHAVLASYVLRKIGF